MKWMIKCACSIFILSGKPGADIFDSAVELAYVLPHLGARADSVVDDIVHDIRDARQRAHHRHGVHGLSCPYLNDPHEVDNPPRPSRSLA